MVASEALILQPPQGGHGNRIEPSNQTLFWDNFNWDEEVWDSPSWRLAVEIAVPKGQSAAIWGQARWGQSAWSQVDWTDLTSYVAGTQIEVGSGPDAPRPDPGILTITLNNLDPFPFSPWSIEPFVSSSYMGAGTLIRVVMHDPVLGIWAPLYCGIVEDWHETYETDVSGVGYVTVTAVETVTMLARVDDVALGSVVGLDDTPPARIARLLAAAEWRYGFVSGTSSIEPLQSTDMALMRLTECYLVADSIDAVFRTARHGYATLLDKDTEQIVYEGSAYPRFVLSHEAGAVLPVDYSGLPTFDPSTEDRPAHPDSINVQLNSSLELTAPLPTGWNDYDVARTAVPASGSVGDFATRLTIDSTNPSGAASLKCDFEVTQGMIDEGMLVTYRVFVPAGSPYIGHRVVTWLSEAGSALLPLPGAAGGRGASPLVEGWQQLRHWAEASAFTARDPGDPLSLHLAYIYATAPAFPGPYMFVNGNDGAQVWVDDILLTVGTDATTPWQPADGEPIYKGGQSWYITDDGTYGALGALFAGDVITVLNDPADGWVLEGDVVWSVIPDLAGYRVPYDDASLVMANNDDAIVNSVVLSCAGGTQQKHIDAESIARYDPRFVERSNLQYKVTNQVSASEYVADRVLARSHAYRPYSCRVTLGHDRSVLDFFAALDLGKLTDVITARAVFRNVSIASYVHRIVPLQDSVAWTCDITFNTSVSYVWSKT